MRIKVCGMTDLQQMHQLGEMGVEFAGMIFITGVRGLC